MRKRLLGLLALVAVLVGLMPLMAFGSSESQGQQQDPKCYEEIEKHDWVRYRVQKSVWDTKQAYNNGQGAGAAYWVGEGSSSLVSRDPLTIEPQGSHDAPRVVGIAALNYAGASRFNVTSGGNYVANANGDYFYKLIDEEQESQVEKPQGDGWIDLGPNGEFEKGKEIPCPTTVPDTCPAALTVVKATNLDHNGWTIGDDATFVNDGIRIDVAGEWEEVSISRPFNKTLKELGDVLGIDAAPLQYVGLHFHTSKGIIVYEEEPSYNGNLWSTSVEFGVGSGMGYASFAPLEAYVAANPDLVVTQVDVLYTHPDPSSTVVASVTFGCKKFTFDFKAQETTTTTTPEETTTTTPEETTTTTTVEETTTTTVEETTTTTDADSTTLPPVTTPTTPTTEGSLPFTGLEDFYLPTAVALVAAGGLLLALSRRPEEDVA